MKWLRLFLVIPLLIPAAPAAADDTQQPIPSWCQRDIVIDGVSKAEGTLSPHSAGFTWFAFTVHADGCGMRGATVAYRTRHLSTDEADLFEASGTLRWDPWDKSTRTVYVGVYKDSVMETDEDFELKVNCLQSTGISDVTDGIGTVLNDDGLPYGSEPAPVPQNYVCRQ